MINSFVLLFAASIACDDTAEAPDGPVVDPARQNRGRELYNRHGCAGCHGVTGRGDGPAAGVLEGRPRDLRDRSAYRRGASADEINRTLRTGIAGSPMVGYDHLPEVELKLLAEYVVYLQGAQSP